jgi:hypothetical protein
MYFLPLFIYGIFSGIVDSPDLTSSNGGMVSEYYRHSMFKNAAIPSFQFATHWSRAQKLVVAQVYKKFSALNVFL